MGCKNYLKYAQNFFHLLKRIPTHFPHFNKSKDAPQATVQYLMLYVIRSKTGLCFIVAEYAKINV